MRFPPAVFMLILRQFSIGLSLLRCQITTSMYISKLLQKDMKHPYSYMNRCAGGSCESTIDLPLNENTTHISPLWGLGCGDLLLLYTLRSSGARGLDASPFYRHIAPLERKVEHLTGGETPPLRLVRIGIQRCRAVICTRVTAYGVCLLL